MKYTIYTISLLLSFFLIISAYIYFNLFPQFEKFENDTIVNTTVSTTNNVSTPINTETDTTKPSLILPLQKYKYMNITTFDNEKNIANNALKWYDNDINITKINITDNNINTFFTINNPITFETDSLMNSVKGANLNKIELKGPIAMYFSNNLLPPYLLLDFSILFMMKIKSIEKKSTLFEIICNTMVTKNEYIPNTLSVIMKQQSNKNISIQIIYGNSQYFINNIDKNLIINNSINLFALSFQSNLITFYINNKAYNFTYSKTNEITLGSQPIIVNKAGNLNCILYSMTFYKKALNGNEIIEYKKYINSYLMGLDKIVTKKNDYEKSIKEKDEKIEKKDNHIKELTEIVNNISKCDTIITESKPIALNIKKINPLTVSIP